MDKDVVFKRLNFFRGFLTTDKDWNDGEAYHIQKRRLHNRTLHAPGVVRHFMGGLMVTQRDRGDLSVVVSPGYAIDGQGRDLYLSQPVIKQINPQDFKLPARIYVVLRFEEEPSDFVAYKENPQFKGHRRISEFVRVDVLPTEPDIDEEVELARINLQPDVRQIRDASDPKNPKNNEIDIRFVPVAGVAGSFLSTTQKQEMHEFLRDQISVYSLAGHFLNIATALDVLHSFITFEFLLSVNAVNLGNVFELFQGVIDLQKTMFGDVEQNHPEIDKEKFSLFRRYVEGITLLYRDPREAWKHVLYNESLASKQLKAILPKQKQEKTKSDDLESMLEGVKKRSEKFPKVLVLGNYKLQLIDTLNIYNQKSEKEHEFTIVNPREKYRSRQKLKYPDNTEVMDVGVHYMGGHVQWNLLNVQPGKRLIIIRRTDIVRGNFSCDIEINGKSAGELAVNESDINLRWRNWPMVIPAKLVDAPTLTIRETPKKVDRDVNMFNFWVYQEK